MFLAAATVSTIVVTALYAGSARVQSRIDALGEIVRSVAHLLQYCS